MKMELELRGHRIVIVAVYAPTEDTTVSLKDEFERKMTKLLSDIDHRNEIILTGDLNARVGRRINEMKWLEGLANDNGTRLIGLCEAFPYA